MQPTGVIDGTNDIKTRVHLDKRQKKEQTQTQKKKKKKKARAVSSSWSDLQLVQAVSAAPESGSPSKYSCVINVRCPAACARRWMCLAVVRADQERRWI